ncbi:hypothetical protein LP417_34860 (plasmid) [Polaromonas sp. P1-6]|nr:hypothetical protein LP417_34860 [Polaromonas sp. P1-6]
MADFSSLPMPLGFHVIPNIGRLATEFALHGFQEPAKYVTRLMLVMTEGFNSVGDAASLLQVVAPTSMDPLAALSENKDWTGRALRAKASTRRPRATRWPRTRRVRWLADVINAASGGTEYAAGQLRSS